MATVMLFSVVKVRAIFNLKHSLVSDLLLAFDKRLEVLLGHTVKLQ